MYFFKVTDCLVYIIFVPNLPPCPILTLMEFFPGQLCITSTLDSVSRKWAVFAKCSPISVRGISVQTCNMHNLQDIQVYGKQFHDWPDFGL